MRNFAIVQTDLSNLKNLNLSTNYESANIRRKTKEQKEYGMVPFNLNVLAKFDQVWPLLGLLLINLDEYSLARARKLFATAGILGFMLKFSTVHWEHNSHLLNKH